MGFSASQIGSASLFSQIGGTATSAIGGYYSAATNKAMLNSQAAIADTNARIAELGAQSALNQGQQQVGALTLKSGQLKSSQRASMAANGIDLGTGNAAEIQASTEIMKNIDVDTLTANAARNAWGYRTQAMNFQNEAMSKRASAKMISPFGAAATSLIGSSGQIAGSWYSMRNIGQTRTDVQIANESNDPIYSLGSERGWF